MDPQQQPRERREAPRYSCAGEAEIAVPGCGLRYRGRISNLSAAGCYIETDCRLERGTAVEVWMSAEGLPLRLAANLMARRGGGVGLRFTNVSARQLHLIRSLIAELNVPQTPALAATVSSAPVCSAAAAPTPSRRPAPRSFGWLAVCLRKLTSQKPY